MRRSTRNHTFPTRSLTHSLALHCQDDEDGVLEKVIAQGKSAVYPLQLASLCTMLVAHVAIARGSMHIMPTNIALIACVNRGRDDCRAREDPQPLCNRRPGPIPLICGYC